MTYQLLDGRMYSSEITEALKEAASKLHQHGISPKLVVITVGEDDASKVYVNQKKKKAQAIGIDFLWRTLKADINQKTLTDLIHQYNDDVSVSGILVQFPLPKHLDEKKVSQEISVNKDVDGFHPYNIGRIVENRPTLIPCTPRGIMRLLERFQIEVAGKRVAIVGRSQIVGLPLALLMTHKDATVSLCHSKTENLADYIKQADLIVAATGDRQAIDVADIQPGAVVVDVSMNRDEHGKLVGDIDFEQAKEKVGAITPVPGGVGPMTVAMLMEQTIYCACVQHDINPAAILESES